MRTTAAIRGALNDNPSVGVELPRPHEPLKMALFGAYLDESENVFPGTSVRVLSIAGFVAFAEHWDAVAIPWSARLRRAGIEEFHMTEYECRKGAFEHIPDEDAEALFNDLLSIMRTAGLSLQPFAIWCDRRDWGAMDPYPEMLTLMCELVAGSVESSDGVVEIAYIADENLKHRGRCRRAMNAIRDSDKAYARNIALFEFGDSKHYPQLQVADLLAFEVTKHQRNMLAAGPRLRYSLEALLENRDLIPTFRAIPPTTRAG
jgi:hypothetical protein